MCQEKTTNLACMEPLTINQKRGRGSASGFGGWTFKILLKYMIANHIGQYLGWGWEGDATTKR